MRRLAAIALLLPALAAIGCGNDEDGDGPAATTPSVETQTSEAAPAGGTVEFDRVERFTLDHLKAEPSVKSECKELVWVADAAKKKQLLALVGTSRTEVLTCDDVPYVLYVEYPNAQAAKAGLGKVLLPYLAVGETTAVQPLVAVDEAAAAKYLSALKADCGCGRIVKPKPQG